MATTRKTTTPRKTAAKRATTATKSSTASTPRAKVDQSLAARTGRTVKERPYVSAAIATGAVTAVAAAAAAGAYFLSRRDQSINDTAEELGTRIKDGLIEAKTMVADLGKKAGDLFDKSSGKTQEDYAAEALMLKETGDTTERPVDPLVAAQLKAGAVSY